MGEEKNNGSDVWMGHPIASFIGAPLKAVVESSIMSVESTINFIEHVGTKITKDGKMIPRNIPFVYSRNGYDSQSKTSYAEKVYVEVPLIALVNVPHIEIHRINYSFSLEIKSVKVSPSSEDKLAGDDTQKLKAPETKLYGVISAPDSHTRHTDQSTKMMLDIHAERAEISEGLARVLNLMNQAITPIPIERTLLKQQDEVHSSLLDVDELSDVDVQKLYEKLKRYNNNQE